MLARTLPLVLLLALACRSSAPRSGSAASPAAVATDPGETRGVLVPLDGTVLSLWPEEYAGTWLVLEVLPQGAHVEAGEVVARFDARDIDEELHRRALEQATSALQHQALLERDQLEAAAAQAARERARAGLDRAQRALGGWQREELAFQQRSEELSRRYQDANVEDQTDELDQLQKMYAGDELVDATEDIVLKRSRRALALTQLQNQLARDRADHRQRLELVLEGEQRAEDVRAQGEAVARLERQQELDARARADAELRSADALAQQGAELARLRQDRALFELRAPRSGRLLHGGPRDHRPGHTPPRHERGSQLTSRAELFVVAPPEPAAVAFDVGDAERARFASGTRVAVELLAGDQTGAAIRSSGTVELEAYPRSLSVDGTTLEGRVRLDQPLAGALYGQRVRVRPAGSAKDAP